MVSCSEPEPRKPISKKRSTFIEKSIAHNKLINKSQENFFINLIKKDSLHSYKTSEKGFWYTSKIQIDSTSNFPEKGDVVVINYEIRDVYNQVIYSKEELGDRHQKTVGDRLYHVDKEPFITGLQEGIKLMHLGETTTFLFPSNKVFGSTGLKDRIAPNQPLIIEVYLKQIIHPKKNTNTNIK
jgi:gliding motility-associated peptidyl-prolyl isomerase